MAEIKQQPRVWHLNWSDIRSLEGRGAYLYNPKGEMVAIIFEQDRPEAEGVTVKIMESLNATASPTESDKEIVERYAGEILGVPAGVIIDVVDGKDANERASVESILTRLLSEYDAQRGVEYKGQDLIGLYAKKIEAEYGEEFITMLFAERIKLILAEFGAAVQASTAQHAPKGMDVDMVAELAKLLRVVEWEDQWSDSGKERCFWCHRSRIASNEHHAENCALAAALLAAQGERGKKQ